MLAQKHTVRVTLDINCYDDLDLHSLNWSELLDLQSGEDVSCQIEELDPFRYNLDF